MKTLPEVGGVKIRGVGSEAWDELEMNLISLTPSRFDSSVFEPKYSTSQAKFLLPKRRGQHDYIIELQEGGDAIITKNGKKYHCTLLGGIPVVLTYVLEQAVVRAVQLG